jgi:hypothetical protein
MNRLIASAPVWINWIGEWLDKNAESVIRLCKVCEEFNRDLRYRFGYEQKFAIALNPSNGKYEGYRGMHRRM